MKNDANSLRYRWCGAGGIRLLVGVLGVLASPGLTLAQSGQGERVISVRAAQGDAHAPQRTTPGTWLVAGTLDEAIGMIGAASAGSATVVIELQPGIHRLTHPLRLTARESGTAARPLIIRSSLAGPATIRGSQPLVAMTPAPADLAHFPAASRPHLLAYDLPASVASAPRIDIPRRHDIQPGPVPFEVFDPSGALHPARWPDEGWATATSASESGASFSVDPERMARWKDERDLWASGFFRWDWAFETRPIADLNHAAGEVVLEGAPHYGFAKSFRLAIHHAAAELDAPGEWVRIHNKPRLIVWPKGTEGLEVSVASQLFHFDGAHHIRLEGLTLERVRGEAITIRESQDIEIAGCTIRWTGGRAISIDGGQRIGVSRSLIEDAGEGGVRLSGGDRKLLQPAGHFVEDTVIRRFSRLGRTYRPAVALEGVGNRAEGNAISDGPHMAIFFSGNEHVIALNEISAVVAGTSDAGAIYTGRDWTAQGTVIKHNFIHDVRGRDATFDVKGVYLDDFASGITVDANLFARVDQPVFIGGGRDNVMRNNVFIASNPAIHIDGRGRTWGASAITNTASELHAAFAAVPVTSLTWIERYPRLLGLRADDPADPKRNAASGNTVLGGEVYRLYPEVNEQQQRLEPAAAAQLGRKSQIAGLDIAGLSASEIGSRLRAAIPSAPGLDLPFARMDRAAILTRRAAPDRK